MWLERMEFPCTMEHDLGRSEGQRQRCYLQKKGKERLVVTGNRSLWSEGKGSVSGIEAEKEGKSAKVIR